MPSNPTFLATIINYVPLQPKKHIDTNDINSHVVKWSDIASVVKNPHIWLCCIATSGYIGWLMLQNLFAPLYIVNVIGETPTIAGFIMTIAGIGNFVIGLIAGYLIDKVGIRKVFLVIATISIFSPFLFVQSGLYTSLGFICSLLFFTQGGQGVATIVMVLLPAQKVKPQLAASAIGIINMVGEIFGGAIIPTLGGKLADKNGLQAPLFLASLMMVITLIIAIYETSNSKSKI